MTFDDFFRRLTGYRPHDWQARLAGDSVCRNRLIRIPTGFGKTAGVTSAWLWNRVCQRNDDWPRRLVLCLPMRTLVEQTEHAVQEWLSRAQLNVQPRVHVLLGGLSLSDWHLEPETEAVLIGTQDMLLSRALNRGYGSGRAKWPMEYGLLNVDCLWVMDEIQLMDVGLVTSAQLQGFADNDQSEGRLPRPRRTWWMSATLQRDWLRYAPALRNVAELPITELEPAEKTGNLWTVEKSIRIEHVPAVDDPKAERWAEVVAGAHRQGGITVCVANTVKSAVALYAALEKLKKTGQLSDVDLRIIHSRFRGVERRQRAEEFLSREHCTEGQNRIIVATQVIEAGVDISADVLVTELAPWASLVQRWGRCARYGGQGHVVIVDRRHSDESAQRIKAKDAAERAQMREKKDREIALPYELAEIQAAAEAITQLGGAASPSAIDCFETNEEEKKERGLLPRLYPYEPLHVLSHRELLDLFDTGPDLTGADIDISRFVRQGDDRDVMIWWWPIPENQSPHPRLRPTHEALCRVPVGEARKWLFPGGGRLEQTQEEETSDPAVRKVRPRAWVWSYIDGNWQRVEDRHVYPGQTILVDSRAGGYDVNIGFTGKAGVVPVEEGHARPVADAEAADSAEEQEDLSEGLESASWQYKTIPTHAAEVANEAQRIACALGLNGTTSQAIKLAAIFHDIGKAHPAFAGAIRDRNGIPSETPLAKAPKGRWHDVRNMYNHSELGKRPGFRHELASALGLIDLLWRACPGHEAIQGRYQVVLDATVGRELPDDAERITKLEGILAEFVGLDETAVNLVLYLVACHHGKVRATLPMSPRDQGNAGRDGKLPIRGIHDGDEIPALVLAHPAGQECRIPRTRLRLDPARLGLSSRYGPSWVERVLALRERYGSFQLAWLEALLRAADVRASQIAQPLDPRLPEDRVQVQAAPDTQDRDADFRQWLDSTLAGVDQEVTAATTQKRRVRRTGTVSKRSRRGAS
ncbi:MAG: CRISPR-associated endonuclease Cas3'' [Bryobacteraceae bacterium]|jgi:CRISPR-associated endonuclease Cas3-HD|nr:CRISPR-associated endonuclease Cas3'' [Bryobacteraceae bacterium]